MAVIAYLIGIISGGAATVQASFNSEIRSRFRSPYITSAINFIVALSIVLILILITEHGLSIPVREIASHPFWIWTGGVCGVVIVMTGILCLPVLGSARNIMILCFGQIMAGLLIDHYGLFEAPVTHMTWMRAGGALLEIIGIILISLEKSGQKEGGVNIRVLMFILLDLFTGFVAAMQVAVNGTMAVVTGSAKKATLISMSGALITVTLVVILLILLRGKWAMFDGNRPPERIRFTPFMLTGGLGALVVVGGNAFTGPVLGTGMVTMMNLFGMMAASLAVDATGFLGIEKKPVTVRKMGGMLLMLAGTAMISF